MLGITTSSSSQIKALLSEILIPTGTAAKIKDLLAHGGYTFSWLAPGAGRLVIAWYDVPAGAHISRKRTPVLVATVSRSFSRLSPVTLKIALTPAGKRLLRSSRKVKLTASGSFAPSGRHATTMSKAFTLTR